MLISFYCDRHKEELYTFFREVLHMHFSNICYPLDTSTYKPLVASYQLNQLDTLIDQWDHVLSIALSSVDIFAW